MLGYHSSNNAVLTLAECRTARRRHLHHKGLQELHIALSSSQRYLKTSYASQVQPYNGLLGMYVTLRVLLLSTYGDSSTISPFPANLSSMLRTSTQIYVGFQQPKRKYRSSKR